MKVVERDRIVVREVSRWRYCLGRQIKLLAGFSGQRATDRRLQKLIQEQFLIRKHILYGLPGLYLVTQKSIEFFDLDSSQSTIRLDKIYHDIAVVDTAIYFMQHIGINSEDIKSEKELRHELGFNPRTHLPDFIFTQDGKKYCVEVEMSLKAKNRLEKNIKDNYLKYETQNWVIPESKVKIKEYVEQAKGRYSNIEILSLEVIQEYVQKQSPK